MGLVTIDDLEPFASIARAKALAMIEDATAIAVTVAPCLATPEDLTDHQLAATKAVMRGAILRWNEAGTGAYKAQTTGPFSATLDDRERRAMFWPSEIVQLQAICNGTDTGRAFEVDTTPATLDAHSLLCSLRFGGTYCSCGADIAGEPIYELDP